MSLRRRTQVIAPAAAYWLHRVLDDLERGGEVQGVAGAEPGLHLCRGYWWNLFVCVMASESSHVFSSFGLFVINKVE